ncbi:MAG: hypothetical protein RBR70_10455 [Arcobacter sp.]|jgi:hypothetical protein|uniref:hypothetical protein n=1 Tax=Arcobacter sp. TaxID=1872629 RepID=UPI002A762AA2|nr:hypothetical protein [Arcobacter sp.]MDY3205480.1 hypothetical protein [Arcobacter sp.]
MKTYDYTYPDPDLIERIKSFYVRFYIADTRSINSVYFEPDLVQKQIYNWGNSEPAFGNYYLEPAQYIGDHITAVGRFGDILEVCNLCPELATKYTRFDDFNEELHPNFVDFFTLEQLQHVHRIYYFYKNGEEIDEDLIFDKINDYSFLSSEINIITIAYLFSRDSIIYKNWRDYKNAYNDYYNKKEINQLLDEFGVKELIVYTYYKWGFNYERDQFKNKFPVWFISETYTLIDFKYKFNYLGLYSTYELDKIYGDGYNWAHFYHLTDNFYSKSSQTTNYNSLLSSKSLVEEYLSIGDDIATASHFLETYGYCKMYYYKFGLFLVFPNYTYTTKEEIEQYGDSYWYIDENGTEQVIHNYRTKTTHIYTAESYKIFFFSYPNYDYEKEKLEGYLVSAHKPQISNCCLFDLFMRKGVINDY